jgi:type II secretory pathway pseudopilin PulG
MEIVIGLGILAALALVLGSIYLSFAKAEKRRQEEEAADFKRRVEQRNEQIRLRQAAASRPSVSAVAKPRVKPQKTYPGKYPTQHDSYKDDSDDLTAASLTAAVIASAYEPEYSTSSYDEPSRSSSYDSSSYSSSSYDSGSSSSYSD